MKTEDKVKFFANELSDISDNKVREFAKKMIEEADDYFFIVPASSSGKYHPSFDLGDGGLVRHTRCVVYYGECISESFNFNARQRDMMIVSALAHDIKKQGDGVGRHTVIEHPILAADYLMRIAKEVPDAFTEEELYVMAHAVRSHMGKWGGKDGLPVPETEFDKCLQAADYIASRKDILSFNFRPTEDVKIVKEEVNPAEYVLTFGKHKGKTLKEVEPTGYLDWMVEQVDFFNREAQDMARKYLYGESDKKQVVAETAHQPESIQSNEPVIDDLPF